jgi:hydrogenase nickel incorporation protein HypB
MTRTGIDSLDATGLDLVFLENVGNLVCPAEFDTGASKNAVILSVPEGDDKPLKYPLMFEKADVVLLNKIDVLPYFDFDLDTFETYLRQRNPNCQLIKISAKTGEGMDQLADWVRHEIDLWRA